MRAQAWRDFGTGRARGYYGGALMMLVGATAVVQGMTYDVGSLAAMGPGFFPVALGCILAVLGACIAGTAKNEPAEEAEADSEAAPPQWRGWFCILLSIVAFIVLGKYGGLLPATFAIVFIAALGDRQNSLVGALVLASAISVVSVVVFWWALRLQLPLFTWG